MTHSHPLTAGWPAAQQEQLRSQLLDLLVGGAALPALLATLASGVTRLRPGLRCAVWQLDTPPNGEPPCLRLGAAAGLPDFFLAALDGMPVGKNTCGSASAAVTAQRMVVADICTLTDTVADQELAARAGVGAYWSQPILAGSREVMGVLSVYLDRPQAPTEADVAALTQLAQLASIAMQQQQAIQRLQDSEARFRALAEHTSEAILVHCATRIVYVNPAAIKLFGAGCAQDLLGTSTVDRIHPDFLTQQLTRLDHIVKRRPVMPLVTSRFLRLDRSAFDVDVQGTAIVFDGAQAVHVSIRDTTRRTQNEQRLKIAASVFSCALEGIVITAADGTIMDANEAFCRITGYPREELLGRKPSMLSSGRQSRAFYAELWHCLTELGQWSGELWNRGKNGAVYVQLQHISAVRDAQGHITQYVALCSDITGRKAQETQLNRMAHFDALTGLPNRVLKADRLKQAMTQALRRGSRLALVFLDLDGFKSVNDSYGHAAGDHLLITLAQRMREALREGDTLARVGGDEFAAILVDLAHDQDCDPLLQRLLAAASEPVCFGGITLQVSASLGVTFYPQAEDVPPDELMRQADQAMYLAKQRGKNRHHVFGREGLLS